ncbi:putative conserved oligomeric Golgi complex subunit [Clavispora lusitaniae]|uniref:Conserved oligomeric Golgi complex subunit 3 n=2 Tax=Clavispora lusitaniae TaxID=36911 RepID=C4YC79_CLAL4|nr:uncharacterized protein CLUG_05896 [Clavispora lusitaniae ATCC 42720]KAF5208722.1 Golgi transport complex subunit 3 [Clavispora lusitaniae]EEQ41768.1 hypothetical protein CLUG_05896 [Clavispora lusitaniae ATCC 42720]KAF7580457.1 Sec34-like family protein [Clavispora lusitaniae]QFZ30329.1 putative conserved oligomeric Golgi complex subunit [Clavispora lusitaniae]QFZ35991.1 putative conserved oligomeric Golgi complex subunit [Clavispora lusitaniae]
MTRERSKSVVQKIAFDVPSYKKEDLKLEDESIEARNVHNPTIPTQPHPVAGPTQFTSRNRAKSLSHLSLKGQNLAHELPVTSYPFTEKERDQLTQNFLDTLNYNSVLDSEYIADINDLFDDEVLAFKSDCDMNIGQMRHIIAENKSILSQVNALTMQFDKVTQDTSEFASQSTALMNTYNDLENKVTKIGEVLKMFEHLEKITKSLVSSGNAVIRTGRISSILTQLQDCLDFLEAHSEYKDSELYSLRYRQCMTRGLTLIRNYLIDYLKTMHSSFSQKLVSKDTTNLTLDIYMYSEPVKELTKQEGPCQFSTLLGAIVERCEGHEEYQGLVSDVLQQYFKFRLSLIDQYIEKQNSQQQSDASKTEGKAINDTVMYCQKQISVYKKLLEKEYSLFVKFCPVDAFPQSQQKMIYDQLYNFFKEALEPLYDEVRNRVLREQSISELCHLTNLLASYYEYEDDVSVISSNDGKIEYGELFEPMIDDAQSRLVFRIQNFIDNKLLKYKPHPEDLQLGNRKSNSEGKRRDSGLQDVEENLFPSLYAPLGIALTILSNIYELLNSMVFDDIAHHIVHSCIYMLKNGAMKLAITHLGPIDAKLFYLKNLIALKNQLNNFDIQFVRTETTLDFTSGIQELIQIFRNGQLYVKFNQTGGFLELVKKSTPKVINNMIDAKHEIELELSNAVNDLVTECANAICEPIFIDNELSLQEKSVQLNDNVLMKIPQFYSQILSFVEEKEVVMYLVDLTVNLISSTYEKYYSSLQDKLAKKEYSPQDIDDVMEPETFYNFVNEAVSDLNSQNEHVEFNEACFEDVKSPEPIFENPSS